MTTTKRPGLIERLVAGFVGWLLDLIVGGFKRQGAEAQIKKDIEHADQFIAEARKARAAADAASADPEWLRQDDGFKRKR